MPSKKPLSRRSLLSRLRLPSDRSREHEDRVRRPRVEQLEDRRLLAALELSSLRAENGGDGTVGFYGGNYTGYMSASGDINDDGYDDLILSNRDFDSVQQKGGANQRIREGAVFVVFGNRQGIPPEVDLLSLDGTNGFSIWGTPEQPFAARDVTSGDDINGDGVDDFVVIAGEPHVFFGNPSWGSAGSADVLYANTLLPENGGDGSQGFVVTGLTSANGYYLRTTAMGGDVNGDGISDLAFAEGFDNGVNSTVVLFGRADNSFPAQLNGTSLGTYGIQINGATPGDYAGGSISIQGDLNGDLIDDVVLGAPGGTPEQGTELKRIRAGQTFVLYGSNSLPDVVELRDLLKVNEGDGARGFVINGIDGNPDFSASLHDASGMSVFSGGDFNNDGLDDLAISSLGTDTTGDTNAGEAYIVFGKSVADVPFPAEFELSSLDGSSGLTIKGDLGQDDNFGNHVALGDINGDQIDDLVLTAPLRDPDGRTDAGQTFVVYGSSSLPVGGVIDPRAIAAGDGSQGFVINGVSPGDQSGGSPASTSYFGNGLSLGDLNGDGVADITLGANGGGVRQWYAVYGGLNIVPPPPAPSFSVNDVEIEEGDLGPVVAQFIVTRSGDNSQTVTVDYATLDGTAIAGTDYASVALSTLTFPPGVTALSIEVTINGDSDEEPNETFFLNLTNATGGATITDHQGVATILDDDSATASNVMYVADISFVSRKGGKDWRAIFTILDEAGNPVSGVNLTVTFDGQSFSGTTDSSGVYTMPWQTNVGNSEHIAEVTDLVLAGYDWFKALDVEDDTDGNGFPDASSNG